MTQKKEEVVKQVAFEFTKADDAQTNFMFGYLEALKDTSVIKAIKEPKQQVSGGN